MFTGNDTVDYPTQWALNPVAYQNMDNDQVDWATLAQQWIQMKETVPPSQQTPVPPPPPPIIPGLEGGEAPMEMEGGDPEAPAPPSINPQQWNNSMADPNWNNSWNQWSGWGWPQNSTPGSKPALMPTPETPYSGYSTGDNNFQGYSSSAPLQTGYWTTEEGASEPRSRSSRRHSPSSRHVSSGTSRRPQRLPLHPHPVPPPPPVIAEDTTQTIDAAKRRQLPGWIREGLEKMEREKQKQLDKERELKEREEYLQLKRLEEDRILKEQPDDGVPRLPAKSKFETDSEGSDSEEKIEKEAEKIDIEVKQEPPPMLLKSPEEIMQEVMLTVRRTLTEILLDVTTEQILSVCKEELSRNRSHAQASSRGASVASKSPPALSAIGGGLGLGIYGDSSDSGSGSEYEDTRSRTPDSKRRERSEDFTDGQLQDTIRRRKAEFEKTSREIEARIAEDEAPIRRQHRRASPGTPSSPSSKATRATAEQEGSISDGEGTTTNNRKEQNNSHSHKKFVTESTPPLQGTKTSKNHSEKAVRSERRSRDSPEKKIKSQDTAETDKKSKWSKKDYKERDSRKHSESPKQIKEKSSKKSMREERSGSSSSSGSSESSSTEDSLLMDKQTSTPSDSNSSSSSNSGSSDNSSSGSSDTESTKKQPKKKKSKSISEQKKVKKSKKDKRKSKKDHKHKSSRHQDKEEADQFDLGDKTMESRLRKRDNDEYKRHPSVAAESHKSSRHSTRTPERASQKLKYLQRSRSKSDDKSYKKYESRSRKLESRDDEGRSRDHRSRERRDRSRDRRGRSREGQVRSRDRRGRSREYRDRSREWRDRSRDRSREGRDRSREGRDRSRDTRRSKDRYERSRDGRDREERRDRRDGRSYY